MAAPRGSCDNPDPTLIVTSSRRRKAPSDLLNAEPAVAAVEALVDRIDTLSRSLPTTIAAATKQDKIYHVMIAVAELPSYPAQKLCEARAQARAAGFRPGFQGSGSGLGYLKPKPAQARPKPGLPDQAGPVTSLALREKISEKEKTRARTSPA
ncbi:hypothetical protein FB451DRAFT_1558889 [Mycena latifolia]|nr:hypothetical protein FB451DRAFT_1558889 [Mycena latifolia]